MLYYHAIKLYLKSFLLLKGKDEAFLRKVGHDLKHLSELCGELGLSFSPQDEEMFSLIQEHGSAMLARYLKPALIKIPTFETLEHIICNLDTEVGIALEEAGRPVRPSQQTN
jgi:hypothetical protein